MRFPCGSGPFADCDQLRWFLTTRGTKRVTKFSALKWCSPANGRCRAWGREYTCLHPAGVSWCNLAQRRAIAVDRARLGVAGAEGVPHAAPTAVLALVWRSGCILPSFPNPVSADDKPLGGGTDEIERVTGHQGEDVVSLSAQNLSVLGLDDLG